MQMNHKQKLTMARRMRTPDEIKHKKSPFDSEAWNKRKQDIITRVRNKEITAKYASDQRKSKIK